VLQFALIRCLVDGTIPPSAGLSSSSALVVSGALGLWLLLKINIID
jgi:galactokinase